MLEWISISYFRGYSQRRDWTHISCVSWIGKRIFTTSANSNSRSWICPSPLNRHFFFFLKRCDKQFQILETRQQRKLILEEKDMKLVNTPTSGYCLERISVLQDTEGKLTKNLVGLLSWGDLDVSHLEDNIVERRRLPQKGSPRYLHLSFYLSPEQSSQLYMNGKKVPQQGRETQKTSRQESPWSSHDLVTSPCSNQPKKKHLLSHGASNRMFRQFFILLEV